jgi:hypothetical protein
MYEDQQNLPWPQCERGCLSNKKVSSDLLSLFHTGEHTTVAIDPRIGLVGSLGLMGTSVRCAGLFGVTMVVATQGLLHLVHHVGHLVEDLQCFVFESIGAVLLLI